MKFKMVCKRMCWVLIALFLSLFCVFESTLLKIAFAEEKTVEYTDVLEDLQKDENFNLDDYPAKADDYSLQVIQIAESVNKELFVYVYQPSNDTKDLIATEIRMSTPVVGADSTYADYPLTLLSTQGVFDKYKVENFTVKTDSVRYYEIVQLARPFDEDIDAPPDESTGNTISTTPCEVSERWTVETMDDTILYKREVVDTIKITEKLVGFIRYSEGFKLSVNHCDSHFVAFATDRNMDELVEVDLTYVSQSYVNTYGVPGGDGKPTLGKEVTNDVTLTELEKGGNKADGWFAKKYTWNRIEKTSTLLLESEDLNFTVGNIDDLKNTQWVLRFSETDYNVTTGSVVVEQKTLVSDVTILRLYFFTDGKPYNLGVVDNKQIGSDKPFSSADTTLDDWYESTEYLLILLAALVVGGFVLWLISPLLKLAFGAIFKGVWWVLCLPFRLIGTIFEGIGKLFKKK